MHGFLPAFIQIDQPLVMPVRLNDGRRDSARKYRVNITSEEGKTHTLTHTHTSDADLHRLEHHPQ